jgi:uncharacterized membrane protein YhhN
MVWNIGLGLVAVGLLGLLFASQRESQPGKWMTKPVASSGFLLMAWAAGAWTSSYGIAIFVALVFSWWGDVLLIPKQKKAFLLGIGSFLLGHLAFAVAFGFKGISVTWSLGAACVVVPFVFVVWRWLGPHVDEKMKIPVIAYIVVIGSMLITAFGAYPTSQQWQIPAGAVIFAISDLGVARNRFVKEAFINRLFGLPLYYGAQVIFAWSLN